MNKPQMLVAISTLVTHSENGYHLSDEDIELADKALIILRAKLDKVKGAK